LRILDLSYNYFKNNSILQSLSAMTSLETLNLTPNELQGYFPAQGGFFYLIFYESIYNLITLFLVITKFYFYLILKFLYWSIWRRFFSRSSSNFLQGFERPAILWKLGILNLGDNFFGYSILSSLNGLASLKILGLLSLSLTCVFRTQHKYLVSKL
jgi:hypothetical protein